MTAEIINLNRFRKARERDARAKQADENRARFGRSREERERLAAEDAQRQSVLDGAEREPCEAQAAGGAGELDPGAVS